MENNINEDDDIDFSIITPDHQKHKQIDFSIGELLSNPKAEPEKIGAESKHTSHINSKQKDNNNRNCNAEQSCNIQQKNEQVQANEQVQQMQGSFMRDLQKMQKQFSYQTIAYDIYQPSQQPIQCTGSGSAKQQDTCTRTINPNATKISEKNAQKNIELEFKHLIVDFNQSKINHHSHIICDNQSRQNGEDYFEVEILKAKKIGVEKFFNKQLQLGSKVREVNSMDTKSSIKNLLQTHSSTNANSYNSYTNMNIHEKNTKNLLSPQNIKAEQSSKKNSSISQKQKSKNKNKQMINIKAVCANNQKGKKGGRQSQNYMDMVSSDYFYNSSSTHQHRNENNNSNSMNSIKSKQKHKIIEQEQSGKNRNSFKNKLICKKITSNEKSKQKSNNMRSKSKSNNKLGSNSKSKSKKYRINKNKQGKQSKVQLSEIYSQYYGFSNEQPIQQSKNYQKNKNSIKSNIKSNSKSKNKSKSKNAGVVIGTGMSKIKSKDTIGSINYNAIGNSMSSPTNSNINKTGHGDTRKQNSKQKQIVFSKRNANQYH